MKKKNDKIEINTVFERIIEVEDIKIPVNYLLFKKVPMANTIKVTKSIVHNSKSLFSSIYYKPISQI